jgi:hypothetical protein
MFSETWVRAVAAGRYEHKIYDHLRRIADAAAAARGEGTDG